MTTSWLYARHHLAFIVGLLLAVSIAWWAEANMPRPIQAWIDNFDEVLAIDDGKPPLRAVPRELSEMEKYWARTAWKYFQNNYQQETGMVNSVDGYPSTTLWDLGSYVMGALSARELGIIQEDELTQRIGTLLDSLAKIPLVNGKLPNKAYDTRTLKMTDYNNKPTEQGVGWSAIDIARFGVPMQIIVWRHPQLAAKVKAVINRWSFDEMVENGELYTGSLGSDFQMHRYQEGRFGYEQYAAKALVFMGLDVTKAARYDVGVAVTPVEGQPIAYDTRLPRNYKGTHNAVVSEPYILEGIEYGFNAITLPLARSVLLAQKNRHARTNILTAVSEDHIDQKPWFVYYSVLNDLKPWAAFDSDHHDASDFRCLSSKAAMGWAELFEGAYPLQLRNAVKGLINEERGWYSGRYEKNGNINTAITGNTNGIILEILAYQAKGPLLTLATKNE